MKCDAEVRFAIAIVTPIMSRVHTTIKHPQELAFCDSTSNVDEFNSRFFLVYTHSPAGGLPLGVVITGDESKETLIMAFNLLKKCFPKMHSLGVTTEDQRFS